MHHGVIVITERVTIIYFNRAVGRPSKMYRDRFIFWQIVNHF